MEWRGEFDVARDRSMSAPIPPMSLGSEAKYLASESHLLPNLCMCAHLPHTFQVAHSVGLLSDASATKPAMTTHLACEFTDENPSWLTPGNAVQVSGSLSNGLE